jgi:hypothetical protein
VITSEGDREGTLVTRGIFVGIPVDINEGPLVGKIVLGAEVIGNRVEGAVLGLEVVGVFVIGAAVEGVSEGA